MNEIIVGVDGSATARKAAVAAAEVATNYNRPLHLVTSMNRNSSREAPLLLGDQLAFDSATLLHLSRREQAEAIRPPAALVGRQCELCQVAFEPTTLVVLCATCNAARHLEGADTPESERLSCADLGPCPVCQAERAGEDGFAYWPEN